MLMPAFPVPGVDNCATGACGGHPVVLCDILDGEVVGSAVLVYEYDEACCPTGPPTLIDTATGDPYVVQGVLQSCPSGEFDVLETLEAHSRIVTEAGAAWTPAEAVGVLTAVSLVVLVGSATVVDAAAVASTPLPAGLSLSWTAADGNTLVGPDSIDAITVGGSVLVSWTERV